MKIVCALLAAGCAAAQDTAIYQSSTVDVNGRRIEGPQITALTTKGGSARTERLQSINGRMVPVEQITERVIRDDSSGRVVERTIQRFDQDGHPTPPEMALVEQENRPGGNTTIRTTTSRRDINGNLQVTERSVTETQKNGNTERSDTVIERPSINGSLDPVERRSLSRTGSPEVSQQTATTYRRGANGFYEAVRMVTDRQRAGATTIDQIFEYEIGSTGSLELHSQTARKSTTHPDGSQTDVVDVFGESAPGTVGTSGSGLKLQAREFVERSTAPDGSVRETLRLQRPTISDSTVLTAPRVVSETICKGKCHE